MSDATFHAVLSEESQYGIIWDASWKKQPCAIKMVMLRTQIHYNQDKHAYIVNKKKQSKMPDCFKTDEAAPFLHTKFAQRKSMSRDQFLLEKSNMTRLARLGLGPKVFACWISVGRKIPIDYGFLVMEKGHCSLKDLIVKRQWHIRDEPIITNLVTRLHQAGMIHGDLKPSNMIVWIDSKSRILEAKIIDAQKVQQREQVSNFTKGIKKDQDHFKEHVKKNQQEAIV